MNASTQATLIRKQCYHLAGITPSPLKEAEYFSEYLANVQ